MFDPKSFSFWSPCSQLSEYKGKQESANIFCKRPECKEIRLCNSSDLSGNYSTLQQESSHRQYIIEWTWLCSSKALFTGMGNGWELLAPGVKHTHVLVHTLLSPPIPPRPRSRTQITLGCLADLPNVPTAAGSHPSPSLAPVHSTEDAPLPLHCTGMWVCGSLQCSDPAPGADHRSACLSAGSPSPEEPGCPQATDRSLSLLGVTPRSVPSTSQTRRAQILGQVNPKRQKETQENSKPLQSLSHCLCSRTSRRQDYSDTEL